MLSWLAITYNTARLGLEAQNAAAFRLLRLAAGSRATGAVEVIPEQISLSAETALAAMAITPKRRHATKNVHKKSAPVRRRGKRAR